MGVASSTWVLQRFSDGFILLLLFRGYSEQDAFVVLLL